MKFEKTNIEGVWLITPDVHPDSRGYFMEAFNEDEFNKHVGEPVHFIQDNESCSSFGVIRGLHYQKDPFAQAKLVRVIKGIVLDIAMDMRKDSPTFGEHVEAELSEYNKRQLFIPRGFAHGFAVLSSEAIFTYKVDNIYKPEAEAGVRWDDPTLGIIWPLESKDVIQSEKDKKLPYLVDAEPFENYI